MSGDEVFEGLRGSGDPPGVLPPECEVVTDEVALARMFEGVERLQFAVNRDAAARAGWLADTIDFARRHPWIYALPGDGEPERTAERCAVLEASVRFQLGENTVRTLVDVAERGRLLLPALWERAREGFAALTLVEYAVGLLPGFVSAPDGARDEFDRALAELVLSASPAGFRKKATLLARRLAPVSEEIAHAEAFTRRRVFRDAEPDEMALVGAHVSHADGARIFRHLTSIAKHMQKTERAGRTRDQIRADLFVDLLTGKGTPSHVVTKVFVTVPLDTLTPDAQATVRTRVGSAAGGLDLASEPQLLGEGPMNASTARRALLDAGQFTRVITDPVTGVILDMDRRARTVTRAQREWLILTHGICTRDGCTRSAADADIDHRIPFHGPGQGPTNIINLHPFCAGEHTIKHRSTIRFRARPDGSTQLISPTGYRTTPTPTLDRLLPRTRPDTEHQDHTAPPF